MEALKHFHEAFPDVLNLVRPILHLINGAISRPDHQLNSSGRVSLDICSLGELIDRFHTHEATLHHDKVYALLGMSSASAASLLPDYSVPWKELLGRLVKSVLSEHVFVEALDHRGIAVIKIRGCVIGNVSSVSGYQDGRKSISIVLKDTRKLRDYSKEERTRWTLQASAMSVQEGDLVCTLQGTSNPIIIRPCIDYFAFIMISAIPLEATRTESEIIKPQVSSQSITDFPYDFLLVWNWEVSSQNLQNGGECGTFTEVIVRVSGHSEKGLEDNLAKGARLQNVALILQDWGEYSKAGKRLEEATKVYEKLVGKKDLRTLSNMASLAIN